MYLWLKAVHVAAVVTWMAGLIVAPAVLVRGGDGAAALVRAHFKRFTTPAMLLALALGVWLALDGGWFRAGWLHAKLVLVLALTAAHGVLAGQLRRTATVAGHAAPAWAQHVSAAVVAAVLAIAVLVIVKPGMS